MNLRRSLHTNKGYTLIELMITLFIFAIITMFGVPAFYEFIEQSRAKSQMVKAANFLRSAQEIATSSNRTVYVYTEGYFDYGHPNNNDEDYWYKDWIMSFKPIGRDYIHITPQDIALRAGEEGKRTANPNYLIAQQSIFTPSQAYSLNILDSREHDVLYSDDLGNNAEGYSKVRSTSTDGYGDQGSVIGKPTYLIFYPSGAVIMPIFILAKKGKDYTFRAESYGEAWQYKLNLIDDEDSVFTKPFGILAGCRMGRGLTIDAINYTFNSKLINYEDDIELFASEHRNRDIWSAPSFNHEICGTKALQ